MWRSLTPAASRPPRGADRGKTPGAPSVGLRPPNLTSACTGPSHGPIQAFWAFFACTGPNDGPVRALPLPEISNQVPMCEWFTNTKSIWHAISLPGPETWKTQDCIVGSATMMALKRRKCARLYHSSSDLIFVEQVEFRDRGSVREIVNTSVRIVQEESPLAVQAVDSVLVVERHSHPGVAEHLDDIGELVSSSRCSCASAQTMLPNSLSPPLYADTSASADIKNPF